ncbi:MAG: T9SS type A sorting domain-containing protein [Cyclobacteriaceae bacterium]|nr:T9SS type A sorting domain-containing protein [Cyclobacteriaceae bacterium]
MGTTYYYATAKSDCGTVPTAVSGAFTVTAPTEILTENLAAQTICFGSSFSPISITAKGTGTISYQWYSNTSNSNSGGTPISGATNASFTPPSSATGTTYYYVVASSTCGPNQTSSASGAFTVNTLPVPTFTAAPSAPVCVGAPVTYTTQPGQSDYVWAGFGTLGTDYTITAGGIGSSSNSVTVTWLTSGSKNISVRYTDPNGCTAVTSATNSLTVNPLPVPTFTAAPSAPVCAGSSVTYTTQSGQTNYTWTVPGVAGTDYTITSGGIGTSSNTVTLTWLTSGSKNVTVGYTNSNGCTATTPASNTLTVNALPVPTFTSSPGGLVCMQQGITYTTQTGKSNYVWSIPGTAGTDYTITAGGIGSTSSSVTLQWLTTGNKTVTVRYTEPTTGCVATATASSTTTVQPFATVGPTSIPWPSVCRDNNPVLTPFTQPTTGVTGIGVPTGLPAGVTAVFNSTTGNIEFSGNVSGAPTGLYTYSIPLTGNCINGLTATGTIDVTPVYDITAISSVSATTIGGSATVFFYGDPASLLNGIYEVSYQIRQANGAFNTQNTTATVSNGRGTFSIPGIMSNTDTYTVQLLSIKKSTDVCTISLTANPPTTYFGVCSAVFGGNGTFVVPANIYSITIEVYGGGGAGDNGGGGGGGYSIRQNIPVTPGEPLGIFIGQGGTSRGANGGNSYVTRDSSLPNQAVNSMVFAYGGNGSPSSGNANGGAFDPRYSGSNGNNASGNNGGKAGGPVGGNGGASGENGINPGGGGGSWSGTRGRGGNGLVVISYSCPDADKTDCITVIDDGAKSGTTVLEITCDYNWVAPEGLSQFTVYVGGAGGGGGSGEGSGGGGSGALIQQSFTTTSPYGLPANSIYSITVGEGGLGAQSPNNNGFQGGTTTFSGPSTSAAGATANISVVGGGGGGSRAVNTGGSGSSGGGGSATPSPTKTSGPGGTAIPISYTGTNVTVYQGNVGGNGDYSEPQNSVAGGGGGGLVPWGNGNDGQHGKAAGNGQGEGGRGGDGIVLTLGDSTRRFGAGGGGIGRYFNGTDKIGLGGSAGGIRIGGSGNLTGVNPVGTPGTNKTGSGGGAGYYGGGNGGSGIVYITFVNVRILEVEFQKFEASYNSSRRSGDLTWTTAKEWDNSHFEIERSVNGIKDWIKVGQVDGSGYSDAPITYTFSDPDLPAAGGNIFYRLKQVDHSGKFSYSVTRAIQVEPIKGSTAWIVYPNPTDGREFHIEMITTEEVLNGEVNAMITTSSGQTQYFTDVDLERLSRNIGTYLQPKAAGVYVLSLSWNGKTETFRIIKK